MKRNIFFFILFFALTVIGFSQSLQISDDKGNIYPSNTEIIQATGPDGTEIITYLFVKNVGSKTIEVLCKKTQLKMHDSTEVTMCWAGGCYPATTFVSPNAQQMASGQVITDFVGHYLQVNFRPLKTGESVVRWTFFDQSNTSDSASITVKYDSYPLGISNPVAQQATLSNIYPNPASAQAVVGYDLSSGNSGALIIRDMIGKEVYRQDLTDERGKAVIRTVDFSDGIYFCTLMVNDKAVQTKKMILRH